MGLIPIAAFLLALLIGTTLIAILGINPLIAYRALLISTIMLNYIAVLWE